MVDGAAVHLLDATMFWNTSGGVRRYIVAKRHWAERHTSWRHTVATPVTDAVCGLRVPSVALPGSGGDYRMPLRRAASARVLRSARPDLIESGDPYRLAWAALDAAQGLGIPAVAFCHSNLERMAAMAFPGRLSNAARRVARRYAARLYNRFDLVLTPSQAMLGHLTDWGVRAAVRQPLGVDTGVFHPQQRSVTWRASLQLPADARLLIYAGRFAPEKNLAVLAEATRRLGPRYWLLAVGAGTHAPTGDRVIVRAALRDPAELATALASSDLFVHAGTQETFGLSALEAMACGTPVVARGAEGLAELVDSSVGASVAGDAPDDFADAIADAAGRDLTALGAAARQRAAGFDWEHIFPMLWRHYERALGRRPDSSIGGS